MMAGHAGGLRAEMSMGGHDGTPTGSWEVDVDAVMGLLRRPDAVPRRRLKVQLDFSAEPDVRIYRGRKLAGTLRVQKRSRAPRLAPLHTSPQRAGTASMASGAGIDEGPRRRAASRAALPSAGLGFRSAEARAR
jgi:hypothetical protein